ncbi:MAG: hypothetical protein F6K54_24315 [Okeania sp. SIO3B5]|uniref:hypothetical protein n=1 Tax=Okeania sp. SIO3B5 TaxID=2607811 RepID=UPI001400B52F|nr:hypothetical protein [Okeania sp. SIO3B5]NEO55915.1 hypothetical protein [Okeania sp. SIO3B5]
MKYAESLLLGGQLISADEAHRDSYKELLCVCPFSKKEVFVEDSKKITPRWGRIVPVGPIWKHSEKIDAIALDECQRMNKYYESKKDMANDVARTLRLSLLKPYLWELILSSAILDNSPKLENYEYPQEDRLMVWFDEHVEKLCNSQPYQVRVRQECENLYKTCIKKTLENNHNQSFEKIAGIYDNHSHRIYGQQIASEVLECVLATWEPDDIRKLIYIAANNDVYSAARSAASLLSGVVKYESGQPKEAEFVDLWVEDKYLGMNKIPELTRQSSYLAKIYKSSLAAVDKMFTLTTLLSLKVE